MSKDVVKEIDVKRAATVETVWNFVIVAKSWLSWERKNILVWSIMFFFSDILRKPACLDVGMFVLFFLARLQLVFKESSPTCA